MHDHETTRRPKNCADAEQFPQATLPDLDRDAPRKSAKALSDSPKAIAMRRSRAKDKALFETIAPALVEARRLGQWDDGNKEAIARALWQLVLDWAEAVAEDGNDPVRKLNSADGERYR